MYWEVMNWKMKSKLIWGETDWWKDDRVAERTRMGGGIEGGWKVVTARKDEEMSKS